MEESLRQTDPSLVLTERSLRQTDPSLVLTESSLCQIPSPPLAPTFGEDVDVGLTWRLTFRTGRVGAEIAGLIVEMMLSVRVLTVRALMAV